MKQLKSKRFLGFLRHLPVKISGIKTAAKKRNNAAVCHVIFAGQFIPWKVAPQQSLPPLQLTMQSLHI